MCFIEVAAKEKVLLDNARKIIDEILFAARKAERALHDGLLECRSIKNFGNERTYVASRVFQTLFTRVRPITVNY